MICGLGIPTSSNLQVLLNSLLLWIKVVLVVNFVITLQVILHFFVHFLYLELFYSYLKSFIT